MAGRTLGVSAIAATLALLATAAALPAEEVAGTVYITNMSVCTPQSALADGPREGRWQLIPYETVSDPNVKTGTIAGAASYTQAPEITLPLDVSGWHAVYVGYWNPFHAYDGGTTVKVRLSDDPAFVRILEKEPGGAGRETHLTEVFVKAADLTGRDLVFSKVNGPLGQKAYVAYVKLVPLSADEVAALQAERPRPDARAVEGAIDGISYFWANEYRTRAQLLELVEPFRHSDVGKVIWAVNYGEVTNYPSKFGTLWSEDTQNPILHSPSMYIAGEKAADDSLRELVSKGIIPEQVVAPLVHEMGIKFDLMFRLGIASFEGLPPRLRAGAPYGFLANHPQYRMALADGTLVEKASYAYPQVRGFMLSLIEEAATMFDVDGVNLGFVRGPEFLGYDKPVLDEFRRRYGEDGTKVGYDDPRMRAIRCGMMTRFVRDARRVLDRVGEAKGRRIELSAWVYGGVDQNLNYGFDVLTWINEGYLDSLIGCGDTPAVAAAGAKGCRIVGAAHWDIDIDSPGGRAAYIPEVRKYAKDVSMQLKTIGGIDVGQGLWDAAYSGG